MSNCVPKCNARNRPWWQHEALCPARADHETACLHPNATRTYDNGKPSGWSCPSCGSWSTKRIPLWKVGP